MRTRRVGVQQVEPQLLTQLLRRLERRPLQQLLVQRPPVPLRLPVRPPTVRPRVLVLDPQLPQQPLHRMPRQVPPRGRLRPVVRQHGLEPNPVLRVQQVEAPERREHHAQTLQVVRRLRPSQPRAGVHHGHEVAAALAPNDLVLAEVMAVEMAQLAGARLDDLAFGLLHRRGQAVQAVAFADGVDGGGLRRAVAQFGKEDSVGLVAVDALAALFEDEPHDEGGSAAGLPAWAALGGKEGVGVAGLAVAVVVLGEGLAADAVEGVEVLDEAELGALLALTSWYSAMRNRRFWV